MNILLITPGINKKFNDNYYAYKYIADQNNKVLAISNKENINKGGGLQKSPEYEEDGSLEIHRIFNSIKQQQSMYYRLQHKKRLRNLLSEFCPDVIFCEEISNLKFAIEMKKVFNTPIVLRTEFAFDIKSPYRNMGRFLKLFKNPITKDKIPIYLGSLIWNWAYFHSSAVISCYHEDLNKEPSINNIPFRYIPWPTHYPELKKIEKKEQGRVVFIGAFDAHKNLSELLITIPELIKNTPVNEFFIVGTGHDEIIINQLKTRYPDFIKHIPSLSRKECLELIKTSFFSYSPATRGGWGFIGDSWAMKTPIVVTHNHYGFNDSIDSIVTTPKEISERINSLYKDHNKYLNLIEGGYKRFSDNHSANAVGKSFLEVCNIALEK